MLCLNFCIFCAGWPRGVCNLPQDKYTALMSTMSYTTQFVRSFIFHVKQNGIVNMELPIKKKYVIKWLLDQKFHRIESCRPSQSLKTQEDMEVFCLSWINSRKFNGLIFHVAFFTTDFLSYTLNKLQPRSHQLGFHGLNQMEKVAESMSSRIAMCFN